MNLSASWITHLKCFGQVVPSMLSCISGQCPLFIDVYHHGQEQRRADVLRVELLTKLAHSRELAQLTTTKDTREAVTQ